MKSLFRKFCLSVVLCLIAAWSSWAAMPPQPPTASISYESYVRLTWPSVSGASTGYAIYRSTSSTFSWNNRLATVTSGTTYYDYSATPGVRYYYWVGPRDSSYTIWINTTKYDWGMRTGTPTPPQPTASVSYSSYVQLTWPAIDWATTGYAIYRSTSPTFSWNNRLATVTSGTTYYDYTATPGVTYYYWVGPRDSSYTIFTDAAKYDSGSCGGLTPPQPTASDSYDSYVKLTWPSVSGASTGYVIYRSTSSTFSWTNRLTTVTSGTTYYDYSATPNVRYYYWVGPRDASYTIYIDATKYDYGRRTY